MFSYEERIKAVKLLLQYDISYSTVIRELGFHTKETLWNWYNEYSQNGDLHQNFIKQTKFNGEVQVGFSDIEELPYIMSLVRQSFERQMNNRNDSE